MIEVLRIHWLMIAAASVLLLAPALSVAQGFPDRDAREISSYVLTEAALARYTRASSNLGALAQSVPANCHDEDEGAGSLDEAVTLFNAQPGAQAAIQSAGMTTREFLVFTWSLFQNGIASWALSQPGGTLPAGVSKANVDFYRAHEQELKKLASSDPCSDSDEVEEEAGEEELEEPTE